MNNNRNKQFCYFCKRYNHQQEECHTRIQVNQPCTDKQGRTYWSRRYATKEEPQQRETSPISALPGFVAPLAQMLLNLCVVSLTTCTKLYEILASGDKVRPRINVRAGNQTMSWLFDTGAAITSMNSRSFNTAFGQQKPKKISNAQNCVAAPSNAMNSVGII